MITFLEFVGEKLMARPASGRSWQCPFHEDNHPSFSVNPPKQRPDGSWYPIKFRCHAGSCGVVGDEVDLMFRYYREESFQQRKGRLQKLLANYEKLFGKPLPGHGPSPWWHGSLVTLPGNRGPDPGDLQYCLAELRDAVRTRRLDWKREDAVLFAMVWASDCAERAHVKLEDFVRHCASELIEAEEFKHRQKARG